MLWSRLVGARQAGGMRTMTIRTVNAGFESAGFGEFEIAADAYRAAVRAGPEIASGEVAAGSISATVLVSVDAGDGWKPMRGAVSVSTARLLPG